MDLEASKYQLVEWRVSIYGRNRNEWNALANWFYNNRLAHANVRWLIQIPRLYNIYRSSNEIANFHEMLSNIFIPLVEVTLNPSSNIALYTFLQTVVGIDSVDDESRPETTQLSFRNTSSSSTSSSSSSRTNIPPPEEWDVIDNPPYGYWMYYLYANLCCINQLRAQRNMTTFQFRPHCGEAGIV